MCRNELFSSAGNQGQRACSVLFWPDRQTVPTRFLSGLLYKALGSNSLPKTFDGITKTLDPKTEKPRADSDDVDQISCRKLTSATDRWNVSIKLGCTWSALRLWDFLTPLKWTALLKRCSTETEGEPKYNKTHTHTVRPPPSAGSVGSVILCLQPILTLLSENHRWNRGGSGT